MVQSDDLRPPGDKIRAETHIYPKMIKPLRQSIHQFIQVFSLWTLPTNLHIYKFYTI